MPKPQLLQLIWLYTLFLTYHSVHGKFIVFAAESNFVMKNSYLLGKADLFLSKPLFTYHLLIGLKNFIAPIHLINFQLRYTSDCGIISDVWDGRIWKSFNSENNLGDCFFKDAHNIAFITNFDWFKPFKNSEYKVGGIYMNILNLRRTE